MGRNQGPPTLGVDVGGVIVQKVAAGEDTSFFGSRFLETPAVDGVFDTLVRLVERPFEGRVHLVSKAGPRVEANTRAWLEHHDFFARTGIARRNLVFVRRRVDKAPVCARLGITHFVDDNVGVLVHLATVAHRHLFVGGGGEEPSPVQVPPWASLTRDWASFARAMAPDRP
jgi:hypothetical protein